MWRKVIRFLLLCCLFSLFRLLRMVGRVKSWEGRLHECRANIYKDLYSYDVSIRRFSRDHDGCVATFSTGKMLPRWLNKFTRGWRRPFTDPWNRGCKWLMQLGEESFLKPLPGLIIDRTSGNHDNPPCF